jgi:large conductance mechanosensitive channel
VGVFQEFREFVSRGNVVDLAVGVIIGGAFNAVVKSLVEQVVMPPIGLLTSGVDFAKLEFVLKPEDLANKHAAVAIQYGAFINTLVQFLLTAAAVFALVKVVNILRRKQAETPAEPPAPTASEALLMEIRDLLKAGVQ